MLDAKRVLVIAVILFLAGKIDDTNGACILNLDKDFGTPSPVFLRNGDFMKPNTNNGSISLGKGEALTVACPGKKIVIANTSTTHDVLLARCIAGSRFTLDSRNVTMKDVKCSSQPWFSTELTGQKCSGHHDMYRVGYRINNTFHTVYEACFDKNILHTYYVKHELSPNSIYMQTGVRRPNFIEGNLYGKVRMNELYKTKNQKLRLDSILGYDTGTNYLTSKQFLTRGHLAARADYSTSAELRATFHYVNCVPQWMRGNAGDWAALEEAVRRRVRTLGSNVTIYTGAHGVMTLPDTRGLMQEIYLAVDENNNGLVPVPMYNYKLVYDSKRKKAAVFISINSSFYNSTILDNLQFCQDICEDNPKFNWLSWRSSDGTHSFCCEYEDFVTEVDYLPKLEVKGMFY